MRESDEHSVAVTVEREGGLYTWNNGRGDGHGGNGDTQLLVSTKVTGGGIDEAVGGASLSQRVVSTPWR
jgi:hypothetical protein